VLHRPPAAGQRLRSEVETARATATRELFARLPAEDRAELARILRRLVE
jgi:DNA-binding MarR family transcriptional regulator